ncbi:MAG: hypothetical protein GY851_16370 [bacterium]|nr:hypothetical protein [bacterium]
MLAFALPGATEEGSGVDAHRTDWFRNAKWGVFTHYMADTVLPKDELSVDRWNAVVDSYDVDALAAQLEAAKAGYFIITMGQNSGYYCSPNAAYDRFVGIAPSRCSERDLIADLYDALHPKGIRLMVYLPSGAPDRDPEAMEALKWKKGNHRFAEFQEMWEAVIREWSERWGAKVSGWWFDGCYYADAMYRHDEAPNFASFAAAARAGNPDSIVAFNPGVEFPIVTVTPEEDYTAGEITEPEKVACDGRWVESAQYHMLSYLGPRWCASPVRFTDDEAVRYTKAITDKGGVVSWDVPPQPDGTIPEPFMAQLRAIGAALAK